jgi:nucleotide-binding universal stress UspA family protein
MKMPFRSVLAATDFSEAGNAAVETAYAIAANDATVHLLHFPEPEISAERRKAMGSSAGESASERKAAQRLLELVPASARGKGIRTETHVIDGPDDPVAILERESRRLGAEVIVLGSHGGNMGLKRILLGSVAAGAVRKCTLPVLLVRPPKRSAGA